MPVRAVDDKPSDTLVVVSGEGFWTGSSTLPHLHQLDREREAPVSLIRKGGGKRQHFVDSGVRHLFDARGSITRGIGHLAPSATISMHDFG
jgi:hypothetical protein